MFSNDPLLENASPAATTLAAGLYLGLLAAGIVVALPLFFRLLRHDAPWTDRVRAFTAGPLTWADGGRIVLLILTLVLLTMACATPLHAAGAGTLMIVQSLLIDAAGLAGIAALLHGRRLSWRAAFCAGGAPAAAASAEPDAGRRPLPFRTAFRYGGIAYLAMLPLIVFAGLVSQGVLSARGIPPSLQDVAILLTAEHSLGVQTYLIFLAIGLAPLFEETVFRGVLLPLLARRFGLGAAVVATSALFSAIHLHLYSAAPLFVVAVGFSLAYAYTGSLWVPVVMHGLFNGINLLLLLILRNY